ncbi:hypothetical protein B9Z55_025001 [Caenorhabditis nigoni]|uniref:Uncharacterized protein n=1 Tax=Caenorhabditis nigoni TaxID=1611254 RepID=A0A2G5SWE6_9PELO|nr:hypothetical protein B9Z55_025001 [Caenorhabditis nigoni]
MFTVERPDIYRSNTRLNTKSTKDKQVHSKEIFSSSNLLQSATCHLISELLTTSREEKTLPEVTCKAQAFLCRNQLFRMFALAYRHSSTIHTA